MSIRFLVTFYNDLGLVHDEYITFAKSRIELDRLIQYHLDKYHGGIIYAHTVERLD